MSAINVLKVGGSLLTTEHLPERVLSFLTGQEITQALLVLGGGTAADEIRLRQRRENLSEVRAHWLAIEAMADNSRRFSQQNAIYRMVRTRREAVNCWHVGKIPVLDPSGFLIDEELIVRTSPQDGAARFSQRILPASWSVTSDSIAAWIAARWSLDDISQEGAQSNREPTLWLLKSCSPGDCCALQSLKQRQLVDEYFPACASEHLRILWVNLRDHDLTTFQPIEIQCN